MYRGSRTILHLTEEGMIRTPVCTLLGIEHPIALGGMGSIYAPELVAAVSNAGGLGAMGCHSLNPDARRLPPLLKPAAA